jgi:hypothetical protein
MLHKINVKQFNQDNFLIDGMDEKVMHHPTHALSPKKGLRLLKQMSNTNHMNSSLHEFYGLHLMRAFSIKT